MNGISEFDNDRIYPADEVGVLDQGNAQVRIVLASMVFAQADDIGFVPSSKNPFDYILQSILRRLVRLNYGRLGLGESATLMFRRK